MAFYVGQKVVCVDDTPDKHPMRAANMAGLMAGTIYTVRAIRVHDHSGRPGLMLQEIMRPILGGDGREQPFSVQRFRPAVERKTDISIFTRILDDVKHNRATEIVG